MNALLMEMCIKDVAQQHISYSYSNSSEYAFVVLTRLIDASW